MKKEVFLIFFMSIMSLLFAGCTDGRRIGNFGTMETYPLMSSEAEWIRNGEPIEFEGEFWYPKDGVDGLLDSEVFIIGEYRGVQYFVDKVDVRPYARLYTKFAKNKFRFFEKEDEDKK